MKMKLGTASLTIALMTSCWCSALPPKEHKERQIDPKLSHQEHDLHGEHNQDYDHDAFLGEDEAKEFDDLTPEESKRRLGVIVDKIDKNGDGQVTEEELQHWIQYVQKRYVLEDTDRMWKGHEDELEAGHLTWDSYRNRTYGYQHDPEEGEDFATMVSRDQRKFQTADINNDGKLSKEEYTAFLHPEEAEHMQDIVVQMNDDSESFHIILRRDERKFKEADQDKDGKLSYEEFMSFVHPEEYKHMENVVVLETIEDIDKNGDGLISLDEYIADIYDEDDDDEDDEDVDADRDGRPDWVNSEIEQFKSFRDRNSDGHLDKAEVKEWVIPDEYDHSDAEAKHLLEVSDEDGDGKLSKEEILDKYDVFVGSQATDFGEALNRHDEF